MRHGKRIAFLVLAAALLLSLSGCDFLSGLFATTIDWAKDAQEWKGQINKEITVKLPPNGTESTIWGTGIYTDDSSIGTAAVHAGKITFAGGGVVTIRILAGQASYTGSTANNVTSQSYDAWDGSFEFLP